MHLCHAYIYIWNQFMSSTILNRPFRIKAIDFIDFFLQRHQCKNQRESPRVPARVYFDPDCFTCLSEKHLDN